MRRQKDILAGGLGRCNISGFWLPNPTQDPSEFVAVLFNMSDMAAREALEF